MFFRSRLTALFDSGTGRRSARGQRRPGARSRGAPGLLVVPGLLYLHDLVQYGLQVRRKRRRKFQPASVDWMREGEPRRVQERALETEDRPEIRRDAPTGSPIQHVTDDR